MPPQTLAARTERLEERVTILEQLPSRVDALASQISQLREEMHAEFSAVRTELRAGDEETRHSLVEVIRAGDEETRRSLVEEIRLGDEETRRVLRDEIRAGNEETRRALGEADERILTQARVLHEELISRLALIEEGRDRPRE